VSKTSLPVKPAAVLGVLRELRASAKRDEPLVVSGAKELVGVLRHEFARGGVGTAIRDQGPLEGAAALVHVLAGAIDADDEQTLKAAARLRIPKTAEWPNRYPALLVALAVALEM